MEWPKNCKKARKLGFFEPTSMRPMAFCEIAGAIIFYVSSGKSGKITFQLRNRV